MTKPTCRICSKTYTDRGMTRHLQSCLKKHGDSRRTTHLRVTDRWDSTFWMQLVADEDATLDELDLLLRNVWLECCGHLSEFEIDATRYDPGAGGSMFSFGPPTESTDTPIARVLPDGMDFSYTYDFGSSTYLEGTSYGDAPCLAPKLTGRLPGVDHRHPGAFPQRDAPIRMHPLRPRRRVELL